MNPSRTKTTDYRPARVTVAILVHIPHFAGYYAHRLEVLKASMWSLLHNTHTPHDLMVFDNGSCREAAAYLDGLQQGGAIAFLLRSGQNLGKIGALTVLFGAAPGEIVAYADDDFFYHPGWLEAQVSVLDTFPSVGMVSGYAVPTFFAADRIGSNLKFAEENREVEVERACEIPAPLIREWAESTGRAPDDAVAEASQYQPFRLTYRGVSALGAANHDQFVCYKRVMLGCLPGSWSGQLMGQMLELDRAVDQGGYLRLATATRTTQHIGNVVSPALAAQLPQDWGSQSASWATRGRPGMRRRLLEWAPVRGLLLGIYSHLFRWINPE